MEIDYKRAEYNLQLLEKFEEYKDICSRGIKIEKDIPEKSMLFIGVNPSFPENEINNDDFPYRPTYEAKNKGYFNMAINTARMCNMPFGHHDLFQIRETNQKMVQDMFVEVSYNCLSAKQEVKKYVDASLIFMEDIISSVRPQIIIVINAFASRLFFDYKIRNRHILDFESGKRWSRELGTDFVNINGENVPILFSGMLSGRHALDRYSAFRLQWHIDHILTHRDKWIK